MMNYTMRLTLACALLCLGSARFATAHCEVPCGIYSDQQRFEQMLEDHQTIAKAITTIHELVGEGKASPQDVNQVVRWVTTKESHATNTQHIIAQYFMTQRIQPGSPDYVKKLTAAHAVMVAALKCKQTTDPETAKVLRESILDFYRAYEGKEPQLEHDPS